MFLSLADIEWGIHLIRSPLAHWIACTNLNMPLYSLVFWVLALCGLRMNNMLEEPVVLIFKFEWLVPSFTLEWSKLRMWFLTCICLMAGVLVKVVLPTPNWTPSSWITWQCSYYVHPPQLIATHPVIRHQHESSDVVLTMRIRRSAANQRASGTSYQ